MSRVSTFGVQNAAIATLINQQAKIAKTQNQLATGLKLNRAADDPVAAGIAVALDRAKAENTRYGENANLVNNRLGLAEVTLADVGDRIQRLREIAIQANGGIYNQQNRQALLAEVEGQYKALLAIANMPDGQGRYLFAGSQDAAPPFLTSPGGFSPGPVTAASYTTAVIGNFNFATVPGIATNTSQSGAYTQAASTVATDAYQFRIDGVLVSDQLVGNATNAQLDADIAAFIAGSSGAYTQTGTVAGGDLVISRTDGQDIVIATGFSDGVGSLVPAAGVTSDGTFAGAGFVGTHTGGTAPDTSANRSFTVLGPGGTALNVALTTDVTDINGLVSYIQGLPGYAASGVTIAASGNSLQFTASNAGPGNIFISGANEFDVGGSAVAGQAAAQPLVTYVGDQLVRDIEIGAGQAIRDVDAGSEIFLRIGAGRITSRAEAGNTGTSFLRTNGFTDPSQWVPGSYRVVFSQPAPGVTEYQVFDGNNVALGPATGYVPGETIAFNGYQISLEGQPNPGDAYAIGPTQGRSVFQTVQDLITVLKMPDQPARAAADQQNGYYAILDDLQTLGDHMVDVRATFGARMALIDKSVDQREAQMLSIKTTLSGLRDLDYAEAISRLSQESATLDAAQSSFLRMQSLSLFDKL